MYDMKLWYLSESCMNKVSNKNEVWTLDDFCERYGHLNCLNYLNERGKE